MYRMLTPSDSGRHLWVIAGCDTNYRNLLVFDFSNGKMIFDDQIDLTLDSKSEWSDMWTPPGATT